MTSQAKKQPKTVILQPNHNTANEEKKKFIKLLASCISDAVLSLDTTPTESEVKNIENRLKKVS